MKQIISALLAVLVVLPMSAQVVREGNKYFVDGKQLKQKEFALYMQQEAEANLAQQFNKAQTLSYAGWGMFAAGTAFSIAGATLICDGLLSDKEITTSTPGGKIFSPIAEGVADAALVGIGAVTAAIGVAVDIAGITCLGVGYKRMHNAADTYINAREYNKNRTYLSVKVDQDGVGLALKF